MFVTRGESRNRAGERGQAMTEFVIWIFVLLLMISGILWFGKSYDIKLNCLMASRYLAWQHAQVAETELTTAEILDRAQAYYPMTDANPEFTQIDPAVWFPASSLNPGGPADAGFDLFETMDDMFTVGDTTSGWSAQGNYNPNGILDNTLPDGSVIRSQHFVAGGTWHKKQIQGDEIIMGVKAGLLAWSWAVL
jgi:hypothetical protein